MVDLDTRSNNDLGVSTYQLIFSWPYSAANARLCLQAPEHLERVAKERNVRVFPGTSTNLNMIVSHLQGHQKKARLPKWSHPVEMTREQVMEFSEFVITYLLEAEADIHAPDDERVTPLNTLAINRLDDLKGFRGDFVQRILIWLQLLTKAGYDLQEYITKETEIHTDILALMALMALTMLVAFMMVSSQAECFIIHSY
jgi:hypothetical protein